MHDFLAIVAEEMANADLLGSSKYVVYILSLVPPPVTVLFLHILLLLLGCKCGSP